MRFDLLAAGALIALAAPAAAQNLGHWRPAYFAGPFADQAVAAPTNAELIATWPATAAARRTPGNALARCKAAPSGALSDCRISIERPAGAGFGAALLALAPRYRLLPVLTDRDRPGEADVFIQANWPPADTAPDWQVAPQPGDFAITPTEQVRHFGKPGYALMNCLLGPLGAAHDCRVAYDDPHGIGFAQMALMFGPMLRLKPARRDGVPVPVAINIAWHFNGRPQPGDPKP